MKLTIFETNGWKKEYLKEKLKKHKLTFVNEELTLRNVDKAKDAEGIIIFIYSKINEDILKKLPKLKFICTMSTGYDHIDVNACKARKISVSNVPVYGMNTVAEHTFGLILSLSKRIPEAVIKTKKDDFSLDGLEGFDLKDKTLGVIGAGNIGQRVIKIAKGFEMKVIAFNNSQDKKLAKELGFSYVDLNSLLKNSDIITLHLPLIPATKHILNLHNIKLIKKGACLINTARGGLIDTKALVYALDKNILSRVALDVLENEDDIREEGQMLRHKSLSSNQMRTFIQNHKLLKDKDVIVTPHSAFYTREAETRILDTTIGNINSKGKLNSVLTK